MKRHLAAIVPKELPNHAVLSKAWDFNRIEQPSLGRFLRAYGASSESEMGYHGTISRATIPAMAFAELAAAIRLVTHSQDRATSTRIRSCGCDKFQL